MKLSFLQSLLHCNRCSGIAIFVVSIGTVVDYLDSRRAGPSLVHDEINRLLPRPSAMPLPSTNDHLVPPLRHLGSRRHGLNLPPLVDSPPHLSPPLNPPQRLRDQLP